MSCSLFLARGAEDDLFATGFNLDNASGEAATVRIRNASATAPTITVFDRFTAPPNRGYSGVAASSQGDIYLAADLGDGKESFIRKYAPDGRLDPSF